MNGDLPGQRSPAWRALLVVAVMGYPATVLAQPAAVEDLIRQGVEMRTKGHDQWALPLFQKAYDLERSPRTAAQLGLAEASLGYWLSSERHLEEALASKRNPWLIKFEPQIRKTLAHVKASIGEVEVSGNPVGAEVLVNGQPAGKLPLANPVRVGEGAVQVILRAPGHKDASTQTKVEGGKRTNVNISLERLAAGEVTTPHPTPAPVTRDDGPQLAAPLAPATAHDLSGNDGTAPSWVRPASWAAATAAAISLSVGGYGLYAQRARGREFDNYPAGSREKTCSENAPQRGGGPCQSLYNKMQVGRQMMLGGFIAGGALAVAAVIGFATSSGDAARPSEAALAPSFAISDGQATLGLGWSFRF